jgi:poly(A) polymerase
MKPSWTDSAVRRFAQQAGEHLEALLALSRADVTSASASKRELARTRLDELEGRVAALRAIDARPPALPSGLGHALMRELDRQPGVWLGQLKRALLAQIERGELQAGQPCAYYVEAVELQRGLVDTLTEES